MKIIKVNFLLLFLFNYFAGNIAAQSAANNLIPDSVFLEKQTNFIFETIKEFPENAQIAIALIRGEELFFYGIKKNKESFGNIENKDSVFEIGSISKVFTATLLAKEVVEGKIKLEDFINDKIEIKIKDNILFSFQSLANHTSGLPRIPPNCMASMFRNPTNPYKDYQEKQLLEYLSESTTVSGKLGENFEYSNLGAGLLAYTLMQMEGKDYQTLLHEKIFSKYKMIHSTTLRETVKDRLVIGINKDGQALPNWDFGVLEGAGSILSTVEDLAHFGRAHFNKEDSVLQLTQKPTYQVSEDMEIGLAWHLLSLSSENKLLFHNGGTGGYTSSMAIDVENKNGMIILSNVSALSPHSLKIDELCFGLMKSFKEE